jgi:hypothetical protein
MTKIIILFFLSAFIVCSSACSKKTAATAVTEQKTIAPVSPVTDSVTADIYRLVVSFYSIGEGTERNQIQLFEKFISDYRMKMHNAIAFEKSYWGREGEVNYCLKLTEFPVPEQPKFIDEVKKLLQDAKHVHFSENTGCSRKRR